MQSLGVLVVDDESEVAAEIADGLLEDGYSCRLAASGAEALAKVAQAEGAIGVVITDVRMPGMDGRALSELLAQLPATLSVEVILITGHAPPAGAGGAVVRKPFRWAEIASAVEAAMQRATRRRALGS